VHDFTLGAKLTLGLEAELTVFYKLLQGGQQAAVDNFC